MLSISHKSMKINIAPILSLSVEFWVLADDQEGKKMKGEAHGRKKSFFISIFRELDKENGKWQTIDPVYSVPLAIILPTLRLTISISWRQKIIFIPLLRTSRKKLLYWGIKLGWQLAIQVSFPILRQRKIFFFVKK